MDLKISFLSVIRVIFFRRCFFTQILNSLYQVGQIFNISDRFYNYLGYSSSVYFISILTEFLYFTVFVSGLLAGNAIPVDLILIKILLCSHWNHWSPFFFFLFFSFFSCFLLMVLYYHSFFVLSILLYNIFRYFCFVFLFTFCFCYMY